MADTKTNILMTATRLFAWEGYTATSIRDIAEAAGVATGLVNHHFGSKRDLLMQACQVAVRGFGERITLSLGSCNSPDVAELARAAGAASVQWAINQPDAICLLGLVGTGEPKALGEKNNKQLFAYELSSYFLPLTERLEALYGDRGVRALVISRISLLGSLVWICSARGDLAAWGLADEALERHLMHSFATSFADSVISLATDAS